MKADAKRDIRGGPRIVRTNDGKDWRCLLCGALVAHIDDHYEWHATPWHHVHIGYDNTTNGYNCVEFCEVANCGLEDE